MIWQIGSKLKFCILIYKIHVGKEFIIIVANICLTYFRLGKANQVKWYALVDLIIKY